MDDVEEYEGSCSSDYNSWDKNTYRCTDPDGITDQYDTVYLSSVDIQSDPTYAIDGDTSTCSMSTLELKPYIKIKFGNADFHDFHRINLYLENMAVMPKKLNIEGLIFINDTDGQKCTEISTGITSGTWIELSCLENSFGKLLLIEADFGSVAGRLSICEVQVFGNKRSIDCELPPMYFGAKASYTSTSYLSTVTYSCINGFSYIGGTTISYCLSSRYWSSVDLTCYDGYATNSVEVVHDPKYNLPNLLDNIMMTCSIISPSSFNFRTLETMEIHAVTFHSIADWSPLAISVKVTSDELDHQSKICSADGSHEAMNPMWTFYCNTLPVHSSLVINIDAISDVFLCEIMVLGRKVVNPSDVFECQQSDTGIEYKGKLATTVTGKQCQDWFQPLYATPHDYPDFTANNTLKVCRNPGGTRSSPWCFTNTLHTEWEYCPLMKCDIMCRQDVDGSRYVGLTNSTSYGAPCLKWNVSIGGRQPISKDVIDGSPHNNNYCRNPGQTQTKPWCYINTNTTHNYDFCDIPSCPTSYTAVEYDHTITYSYTTCFNHTGNPTTVIDDMYTLCINKNLIHFWCYDASSQWFLLSVKCETETTTTEQPTTTSEADTPTTEQLTTTIEAATTTTKQPTTTTAADTPTTKQPTTTTAADTPTTKQPTTTTAADTPTTKQPTTDIEADTPTTKQPTTDIEADTPTTEQHTTNTQSTTTNIYPTNTTYPSTNTGTADNSMCACMCIPLTNVTSEDMEEAIVKIHELLLIDRKTISAVRQKYISLEDERPSVVYIGSSAVLLFLTPLVFIIFPDIISAIRYLRFKLR